MGMRAQTQLMPPAKNGDASRGGSRKLYSSLSRPPYMPVPMPIPMPVPLPIPIPIPVPLPISIPYPSIKMFHLTVDREPFGCARGAHQASFWSTFNTEP